MQFNMFNILAVIAVSLVSVSAQSLVSDTCTGLSLQGNNILRASCSNGQGGTVNTALDLNACFGPSLACQPNGDFAALGCTGCIIIPPQGAVLAGIECHCPSGTPIGSLDNCVVNNGGILACR